MSLDKFKYLPRVVQVYLVLSISLAFAAAYYAFGMYKELDTFKHHEIAAVIGSCTCYSYTGSYTCALLRGPE